MISKWNILIILFVFLNVNAAEKVYQIEVSTVEERPLFGGLGPSTKPLGYTTEFFEAELSTIPLISIYGQHADKFKNKILTIFKDSKYYICSTDKFDNKCIECFECGVPERQVNLKYFDTSNIGLIRKQVIKSMQYSAVSVPSVVSEKDQNLTRVEFQFPQKIGSPLSLKAKHKDIYYLKKPQSQMIDSTIHILKSKIDPDYYICPQTIFSESCFVCTNCAEKINLINSYERGF